LPELFAAGGQLPDQVGQVAVVGVAAGFGPQQGDGVVGGLVVVAEELGRLRVEENEPGGVGRSSGVGVDRCVQRCPEIVGGQNVESAVEHEGWCAGHGVEDALDVGPDPPTGGAAPRRAGAAGGAEQVFQVCSLRLVELQGVREAVDHAVGDAGGIAALELGHVLRGDPGQAGDLGAAQPRDPAAVSAVHRQAGLLGSDACPAGGEELADLGPDVSPDVAVFVAIGHELDCTGGSGGLGVPVDTPLAGSPADRSRLVAS
jgi:hypothetical protein